MCFKCSGYHSSLLCHINVVLCICQQFVQSFPIYEREHPSTVPGKLNAILWFWIETCLPVCLHYLAVALIDWLTWKWQKSGLSMHVAVVAHRSEYSTIFGCFFSYFCISVAFATISADLSFENLDYIKNVRPIDSFCLFNNTRLSRWLFDFNVNK